MNPHLDIIRVWQGDEGDLIGPYMGLLIEPTTEARPTEPCEDGRWPIDVVDKVRIGSNDPGQPGSDY